MKIDYNKVMTYKRTKIITYLDIINIINENDNIKIGIYTHMEV